MTPRVLEFRMNRWSFSIHRKVNEPSANGGAVWVKISWNNRLEKVFFVGGEANYLVRIWNWEKGWKGENTMRVAEESMMN